MHPLEETTSSTSRAAALAVVGFGEPVQGEVRRLQLIVRAARSIAGWIVGAARVRLVDGTRIGTPGSGTCREDCTPSLPTCMSQNNAFPKAMATSRSRT